MKLTLWPQIDPIIETMARTDALFAPIHVWKGQTVAALVEQRKEYRKFGLPVTGGGGNAAERKEHERALDSMGKAGFVRFRRRQGKRSHVKLKDEADWALRRLCCWSDWDALLELMGCIQAHQDASHGNRGLVSEIHLACGHDDEPGSKQAVHRVLRVEEIAAPGLCREWITSWSDAQGRVGFSITEAGRAILANPVEPAVDWPEYDTRANDAYLDHLDEAADRLASAVPTKTNSHAIPLSAGLWPHDNFDLPRMEWN